MAAAIVANSALSLFYYLRIALVMFFEVPDDATPIEGAIPLTATIAICAVLTILLGIGSLSEAALGAVSSAADAFLGL